jgi:hypothetical protein
MPFDKINDARKAVTDAQAGARQIAKAQEAAAKGAGYARSPGFDPAPRALQKYKPESERLAPSAPLDLSKAGKPKTTKRSFGVNQ